MTVLKKNIAGRRKSKGQRIRASCLSYRKEADASQTLLVRRAMEGLKGRRLFQGLLGYFKDQGFYQ